MGQLRRWSIHHCLGRIPGPNETLRRLSSPQFAWTFYSAVTQFLGFTRDSDEYKVMGMAADGQPKYDFDSILEVQRKATHFTPRFDRHRTGDARNRQSMSGCSITFRSLFLAAWPVPLSSRSISMWPAPHRSNSNEPAWPL